MKINQLVVIVALGAGSAMVQAAPGNPEAGKAKISTCEGCHGIPGYKTTFPYVYSVPRLGGQHPEYIAKALAEYKGGERNHPTMRAIAAVLSEQDMADIGAYYGAPRK